MQKFWIKGFSARNDTVKPIFAGLYLLYICSCLGALKNILLMTSTVPILGTTKDNQKPGIVNYYNYTMGGTDIVDQLMAHKTVRWKSDR